METIQFSLDFSSERTNHPTTNLAIFAVVLIMITAPIDYLRTKMRQKYSFNTEMFVNISTSLEINRNTSRDIGIRNIKPINYFYLFENKIPSTRLIGIIILLLLYNIDLRFEKNPSLLLINQDPSTVMGIGDNFWLILFILGIYLVYSVLSFDRAEVLFIWSYPISRKIYLIILLSVVLMMASLLTLIISFAMVYFSYIILHSLNFHVSIVLVLLFNSGKIIFISIGLSTLTYTLTKNVIQSITLSLFCLYSLVVTLSDYLQLFKIDLNQSTLMAFFDFFIIYLISLILIAISLIYSERLEVK
jgi:hypothetical protein